MCRLTLASFSSFSSGHLKDTVYISTGPRYISRLLLTLLMDERLALLYSNLSIHPDERGVAQMGFYRDSPLWISVALCMFRI